MKLMRIVLLIVVVVVMMMMLLVDESNGLSSHMMVKRTQGKLEVAHDPYGHQMGAEDFCTQCCEPKHRESNPSKHCKEKNNLSFCLRDHQTADEKNDVKSECFSSCHRSSLNSCVPKLSGNGQYSAASSSEEEEELQM